MKEQQDDTPSADDGFPPRTSGLASRAGRAPHDRRHISGSTRLVRWPDGGVAVVTAILLVGLIVGMTGFWILGRSLRKLEGPSVELDAREYELDEDVAGQVGSLRRDEDSPPSNL